MRLFWRRADEARSLNNRASESREGCSAWEGRNLLYFVHADDAKRGLFRPTVVLPTLDFAETAWIGQICSILLQQIQQNVF
ncbi:hypothetical protein BK147_33325 [Paenibacillus sp. FSL R7-0337]|nr:hypothetical protein BK147_33325 [Paenibacillus sp. FSL R7-0337]